MPPIQELEEQARRLREIREGLGISREEMAARLRVKFQTLKGAENGTQKLGMRTMEDAEQLAQHGILADVQGEYRVGREADAARVIQMTLNLAADPTVKAAAKALAAAIGVTESEATVIIIKEKVARQ